VIRSKNRYYGEKQGRVAVLAVLDYRSYRNRLKTQSGGLMRSGAVPCPVWTEQIQSVRCMVHVKPFILSFHSVADKKPKLLNISLLKYPAQS